MNKIVTWETLFLIKVIYLMNPSCDSGGGITSYNDTHLKSL